MIQYSIFHITKYGNLGGIGSHIDRRHIASNVDGSKSDLNEDMVYKFSSKMTLEQCVERRISEGYRQTRLIRKDAVRALGIILGGTHERMKEIETDEALFNAWKNANYDFVCGEFGAKNIVRFSVHRDEKTPHIHCVLVPLTDDGRLSAKYFIGTPAKLRAYQDRYGVLMERFGLQRGIAKELTNREHIDTGEYYKSVNALANEVNELTSEVKASNVLKLGQVRAKLQERVVQLAVRSQEAETKAKYALRSHESISDQQNKVFLKEHFEQERSRTFEWIKRAIPLADFAVSHLGWSVVKEKSTKRDLLLSHPTHGKIIVPTRCQAKNGHWVYSVANEKGGGSLIDLLRQEKWEWKDIRGLAQGEYVSRPVAEMIPEASLCVGGDIRDPLEEEKRALERMEEVKVSNSSGRTYLEKRGIARENYQDFAHLKTNSFQAVFGLYTVGKDQTKLCSTINYYFDRAGERRAYFQKDLPRGLAMLTLSEQFCHIVICESPVDALSYRQLKLNSGILSEKEKMDHTMLLATCGNLSVELNKSLEHVFEQAKAKDQEIILAFDNDSSGKKMSQELERLLQEKECSYHVEFPEKGKDWNEALELEALGEAVRKSLAEDKLYGFPEVNYEDSILHKAGIAQSDLKGIEFKANKRAVIFGLKENVTWAPRLCSTVSYQWGDSGEKEPYFQEGLPRGLAMLTPSKSAGQIVITESPLEAIEHRKYNPQGDSTLYLCTCGPLTEGLKKELSQVFVHAKKAGQSISLVGSASRDLESVEELLMEKEIKYHCPDFAKDMPNLHSILDGIANSLSVLTSISASGKQEDDEEEEKKMKKGTSKGRSISL